MKQLTTSGIVLSRTNYGEADRILTILTPNYGKLRLMARGVRKIKSKLAGGIELFSVSSISFIRGRGEIGTLTSARLLKHYGHIAEDVERTMVGYAIIKKVNGVTEDEPDEEWFELLDQAFAALEDNTIDLNLIQLWFTLQLLRLNGHTPNLEVDTDGNNLRQGEDYSFDHQQMAFMVTRGGQFNSDHIKYLRLVAGGNKPKVLKKVTGSSKLVEKCLSISRLMLETNLHI